MLIIFVSILTAVVTVNGALDCRGASVNGSIVWPLNECLNFGGSGEMSSTKYTCDSSNSYVIETRWNTSNCPDNGGFPDSKVSERIIDHGCQSNTPCNIARVDEYLNSTYTGSCVANTDDLHVTAAVTLDQCAFNEDGQYFTISCSTNTGTTIITWTNYTDSECQNQDRAFTASPGECLGIPESPYFNTISCEFRSPVYETQCRSVSQNNNIVWPLDKCIGTAKNVNGSVQSGSFKYFCDENNKLLKQNWKNNNIECEGNSSEVTIPTDINGNGCDRTPICNMVTVDEYLNSRNDEGVCAQNTDGTDNLRVKASVVLDVCSLNDKGVWMKISCEHDATSSLGSKITFRNYTEAGCPGTADYETSLNEPGCLDIPESPYFTDISCDFRSPVYETDCRSASQNDNIVWPLDECIGSEKKINASYTEYSSNMYTCDSNEDVIQYHWEDSFRCEGQSIQRVAKGINANGCSRSKPCNTVRVDEYLHSRNDQGICAKNTDGTDNHRVNASIVLDTCSVNERGEYMKITCEEDASATFGYKLTFTNYTGTGCEDGMESYMTSLTEPGCLEIPESPYFHTMECNLRSPVYETQCRSVSQNREIIWPIDECITTSTTQNGTNSSSSFKYVCDPDTNDIFRYKYDAEYCQGSPTKERPKDINGDGCDRTAECDIATFDEYLKSRNDEGVCAKNTDGTDNLRVQGSIVLNTCWLSKEGEYNKVRCMEDSSATFGYKLIFTNYTGTGCEDGMESYTTTLTEPGCLEIPESPYFASLTCVGAEPQPTEEPTSQPIETPPGGNANEIKINMFICCLMHLIAYFMSSS